MAIIINKDKIEVVNVIGDETDPDLDFRRKLTSLLNIHSMENRSNTPDFILADYLIKCLAAFDSVMIARNRWYDADTDGEQPCAILEEPVEAKND